VERALTTAWFDEQNRMTPEDVQTATFPLSRLGRRGFEEEAVQEFLKAVHAEFVHLVNERTSLWQEVQRLRRRIIEGNLDGNANGADPQAALFGGQDAHVHAVRILSAAQLTADRYVSDAQAYSSRLTEEAKLRRDEIMTSAQQYSDMLLEEAHAKAREAAVVALNEETTRIPAHLLRRLPGAPAGVHGGGLARHRGLGAQGSHLAPGGRESHTDRPGAIDRRKPVPAPLNKVSQGLAISRPAHSGWPFSVALQP
jgi:DivIVA domain-containing protein